MEQQVLSESWHIYEKELGYVQQLDFQLDFLCFSFKEKGETAESERPGERVNWKV